MNNAELNTKALQVLQSLRDFWDIANRPLYPDALIGSDDTTIRDTVKQILESQPQKSCWGIRHESDNDSTFVVYHRAGFEYEELAGIKIPAKDFPRPSQRIAMAKAIAKVLNQEF